MHPGPAPAVWRKSRNASPPAVGSRNNKTTKVGTASTKTENRRPRRAHYLPAAPVTASTTLRRLPTVRVRIARWEGSTVPKLPLPEAARVLGVSTSALRRRLRAGTLAGEKETTPPYRWLVDVSGDAQARAGPPLIPTARRPSRLKIPGCGANWPREARPCGLRVTKPNDRRSRWSNCRGRCRRRSPTRCRAGGGLGGGSTAGPAGWLASPCPPCPGRLQGPPTGWPRPAAKISRANTSYATF